MEKTYTISEVGKRYNVSAHTLRYYEKIGLIKSSRNKSNYRFYTQAQLDTLEQVLFFRKMGIPISDIKTIFQTGNKQDILHIMDEHKRQIKNEISSMENMRERIYAFLSQARHDPSLPQHPPITYEPVKTWEIDLATMREVPREKGQQTAKTPSDMALKTGSDGLMISGENTYAVSEQEYAIPLTIHATVKIHERNLYLFFGKYRVYFIKEEDNTLSIWLHDYVTNCNLFVYRAAVEWHDGYMDIQWELLRDKTRIFLNGVLIVTLDYINNYDFELASRVSLGTSWGNTVTVKHIRIQKCDGETEDIDLSRMKGRQSEHYVQNGELMFYNLFDRMAMGTGRQFALPLKIDTIAKIDYTDLRLYYHQGDVIFNWEMDKMQLRVRDVYNRQTYISHTGGYITPNEYHAISWILHRNYMALMVDGVCRFYCDDAPYMEYLKQHPIVDEVLIGTAFGSTLTVKSLTVTELK